MEPTKTIADWERDQNLQLNDLGDRTLDSQVTFVVFVELMGTYGFIGVDHEERLAFLKKARHDITRKNMVDSSLSYPSTGRG